MRDYGKVYGTFWSSQTTHTLSDDGKLLALYLMTCSHATIAGVFRLPDGYVAEDIGWDQSRVQKGFAELLAKGFANRCETTKWVWVVKHLDWNKPENPNQRKSAAKIAQSVPAECGWKLDFMRACAESLGLEVPKSGNRSETVGEPFLNQEQEQEQDKEEAKASLSASAKPTDDETDDGVPPCPFDKLIDSYKKHLPELPDVRRSLFAGGKNGKAMRSRWRWVLTAKHERGQRIGERLAESAQDGVAWFDRYFAFVADSDFLTGKSGAFTGCDLGWLVNAANFEKVLSGKYHAEKREAANA